MRESPHTSLQHPHHPPMPHLITHMKREEKAAAAAGPRSLSLFFPSARRAAPHRAWDDLLCLAQPPFFRVGGGKSRGSWGRTSGFSACRRAATCPETAGSPPARTWTRDDGLLQGCNLGCHDAECCNLFFSELGGCRGLCYCPPSGSPVGRSGVHVRPVGAHVEIGNRVGGSIVPDQ